MPVATGRLRAMLLSVTDVEHDGRHRGTHHPQPDGAAGIQRGQPLAARAPVRHYGRQIADVRARDRQSATWQLGLVSACGIAEHGIV